MLDNNNNCGICFTCNKLASCVFRKVDEKQVLMCEEYDNYVPEKRAQIETKSENFSQVGWSEAQEEAKKCPGLCVNCNDRRQCSWIEPLKPHVYCECYN